MVEDKADLPVKLLIVDDSEDDVFLITQSLSDKGLDYAHTQVETLADLQHQLVDNAWDVVIADHNLAGFSSREVIGLVKTYDADLPVIIVSGTIREDLAIDAMLTGAQDFVMKDNLARLIPAILREHKQCQIKRERKKLERKYRHLRYHDKLTQLANRGEFENRICLALDRARGHHDTHWLMVLDLDQFKVINDTCGHTAGDELLVKITHQLKSCIRESDSLARLGGDEFGILLVNCSGQAAWRVARKIRDKVNQNRFIWSGRHFEVSVSVGMVEINEYAKSHQELFSCADIACHAAKDRGSPGIVSFAPEDAEYTRRLSEMKWGPRIRRAAEENKFILHHQPMMPLQGQNIANTEFLLRLNDSGHLIVPSEFIPAAERYNLMSVIDRWVVGNVFKYLRCNHLTGSKTAVHFINLSGSSLSDAAFFDDIRSMQKDYAIDPRIICFEITETSAIDNLVDAVAFIADIRQLGFKFALDDFGVGLSSFSYLKSIPVDFLKIDGSFVTKLLSNTIDHGIVVACNQLAHAAGLQTIAEFVETEAIKTAVAKLGVDFAQGYAIARPGPLPVSKAARTG